jgi:hypothetical protein
MPITDEIICGLAPQSVLDVGVSTGITSLDLIDRLASFSKFYCTDLFFSIPYERVGDVTYFYHPKTKHCIIRATDAAITYLRGYDALPLINGIAKWMLSRAPQYSADMRSAPLLHPTLASRLTSDRRLVAKEYNVFQEWDGEKVDVVKVANVLNREYFSHAEIRAALANLMKALKPEGKLIATDNKDVEKVSVFSKSGLESEVNGGSGVSRVILDMGSAS